MNRLIILVTLAVSLVAAAPAPTVQLSSSVKAEKTVTVAGREQTELRAPTSIVPGDRLLFETAFRNAGAQPAQRVVVTNPVPAAVTWSGDASAGVEVSVDGGRSFGQLAQLHVRQVDGQPRAAQPADVTHLRWTLASIAPGAAGSLRYRGVVR